jgi:uncharacterized protein YbbC (DUF1343 family)
LQGKRLGLLTHPAGVNGRGVSSIDVLRQASGLRLSALFGPEHGLHGDEKADVPVADRVDTRTGLPVFSLYGKFRRPTPEMLRRIDVLLVDLQDIGARSYTYVSCLRYAMEACFAAGVEVVVLDRPNPLGGLKVDGPGLEDRWRSYVGAYPVPYVHGLTIGELARLARATPGVMDIADDVRQRGRLRVVAMQGWRRHWLWTDTGLRFVRTSPAIPDLSAVLGYAMVGLGCQLGGFSHGYGTSHPFRLLQFRGKTPEEIAAALNARRIPGLRFDVLAIQENGRPRRATYVAVTDWQALRPVEVSLHLMALACAWNPRNPFATATAAQKDLFNKHVGDGGLIEDLSVRGGAFDPAPWLERWGRAAAAYQRQSRAFHLYA